MLIGLTGTIGSGKSTVCAMLADCGAKIIDADLIAHDLVEIGSAVLQEISTAFGEDVLDSRGALNRPKMAERVFGDSSQRKKLEGIIHPHVARVMQQQIEQLQSEITGEKAEILIVLDVPLLFEAAMEKMVDRVVVVAVSEKQRQIRLLQRGGLSVEQIESRLDSQWSQERKLSQADDSIDNSGSIEETRKQVAGLYIQWMS